MTEQQARELLDDAELVPAMQGTIAYIKRVVASCLEADIPAALDRCKTKG